MTTPIDLDVPIEDVSAHTLGLRLNADAPPRLSTATVPVGRFDLVLSVIGASHVVDLMPHLPSDNLLEPVADFPPLFREEISSHATDGGEAIGTGLHKAIPLPAWNGLDLPARYEVTVSVKAVSEAELRNQGEELLAAARDADARGWLVRRFPGVGDYHLTALHGQGTSGDAITWETWHLYPEEGTIVHSQSTISGLDSGIGAKQVVPGEGNAVQRGERRG